MFSLPDFIPENPVLYLIGRRGNTSVHKIAKGRWVRAYHHVYFLRIGMQEFGNNRLFVFFHLSTVGGCHEITSNGIFLWVDIYAGADRKFSKTVGLVKKTAGLQVHNQRLRSLVGPGVLQRRKHRLLRHFCILHHSIIPRFSTLFF